MREIKFRFWNPDDKRMLDDHEGWVENIGINEALRCSRDYGYIAMQFTGLKDKNGVEIYEGDVMRWPNQDECGFVQYEANGCQFRIAFNDGSGSCHIGLNIGDKGQAVVIGNIYEHPHLLNSEQNDKRSIATEVDSTTSAGSTKENK